MKHLHFGIKFIDDHLKNFEDKGIYLFYEEGSFLRYSFIYHLLSNEINSNVSCLYITSLDLALEDDHIRSKINDLNRYDYLTILEIPTYVRDIINDIDDLKNILSDLEIFIRSVNPAVIIVQNLEYLVSSSNPQTSSSFIPTILNHFKRYSATVIIDITNFNKTNKPDYQKFGIGTFEIYGLNKNNNYQLSYKPSNTEVEPFSLIFTYDAEKNITIPFYKNSSNITLESCKNIVLMKEFHIYKDFFVQAFNHPLNFIFFSSMEDIFSKRIDPKHTLIFIPSYFNDFNGWSIIQSLRSKFPQIKILLSGSANIRASQKARSIRLGADKYIVFPCSTESFKEALYELYQEDDNNQQRHLTHKIIYASEEFLKGFKSSTILRKPLSRYIKEFASTMVNQGFSLHFYKIILSSEELDFSELQNISKNMVFYGSFLYNSKFSVLLIFQRLTYKQQKNIKEEILQILQPYENEKNRVVEKKKNLFGRLISKLPKKEKKVSSLNEIHYPIDKPDIDLVIDWIYNDIQ